MDGTSIGRSGGANALLSVAQTLTPGARHALVLRATKGAVSTPAVRAELDGAFGKLGTGTQWKVKAASGGEATDATGAWVAAEYDDSGWSAATAVSGAPGAGFPDQSPAAAVWSGQPSDATVLLRLVFFAPSASVNAPQGFGRATTGGAGGEAVTVHTIAELKQALCGSVDGQRCTDTTPRIVQLPAGSIFDFKGTEGTVKKTGCYVTQQCATGESEYITGDLGACSGKQTFDVTLDIAGTLPLAVGSNKTLTGLGAGATLRGKGLRLTGGQRNVIIRNVTLTDINPQVVWGGDAITLDGARDIWIDHVRYSLIARQMLVTGWGEAVGVTVSWNEFDGRTPYGAYCDGAHYWVMLLLGPSDTFTFVGNWIHHTSGRGPHVGGKNSSALLHLVNTYYATVTNHAVNASTYQTVDASGNVTGTWSGAVLLEGTYFRDVKVPIQIDEPGTDSGMKTAPGPVFVPLASTLSEADARCRSVLGRACVASLATPQNGTFPLDAAVMTAFGQAAAADLVTPFPAELVPATVRSLAGPGHL